jgi:hypothetical protein
MKKLRGMLSMPLAKAQEWFEQHDMAAFAQVCTEVCVRWRLTIGFLQTSKPILFVMFLATSVLYTASGFLPFFFIFFKKGLSCFSLNFCFIAIR